MLFCVTRPECCGLLETMKGVWKLCCRTQRADEAAAVALVCVERPRHNNWFMDSRVEPLWGHYPSTNQLIWEQCWPQCHHWKKVRIHLHYINHHNIYFYFYFLFEMCTSTHVPLWVIVCVLKMLCMGSSLTTVSSSCSCTLSFSPHLWPFNLSHSWGLFDSRPIFHATSEPPTVSCLFRAVYLECLTRQHWDSCLAAARLKVKNLQMSDRAFYAGLFLAIGDEAAGTCLSLAHLAGQKPDRF